MKNLLKEYLPYVQKRSEFNFAIVIIFEGNEAWSDDTQTI